MPYPYRRTLDCLDYILPGIKDTSVRHDRGVVLGEIAMPTTVRGACIIMLMALQKEFIDWNYSVDLGAWLDGLIWNTRNGFLSIGIK